MHTKRNKSERMRSQKRFHEAPTLQKRPRQLRTLMMDRSDSSDFHFEKKKKKEKTFECFPKFIEHNVG